MDHTFIQDTLRALLTHLDLPFDEISVKEEGEFVRVDIVSTDASRIIGWHGETLNSLQHLVKAIVRSAEKLERSPFIVLDVDGYRRAQEEKVRRIAEQKADFVRRTGNRVALAPMSPYFRRIVHLHVADTPSLQDLTTESIGEGDYRQVVLRLKKSSIIKEAEELSPVMVEKGTEDGLENLDI
ncbi:MAG: R3H domain-containing nucleic acid-binding protein [Candidatus Peregrinibacteria bacterium]